MNYKQVKIGGDIEFLKLSETPVGHTVEGTLGRTLTSEFGPTYVIETANGAVGVPGKSKLNRLMEAVSPGSAIKIIYQGLQKIESGKSKGKDFHNFDVFVAEGAPLQAAAPQPKKPLAKAS